VGVLNTRTDFDRGLITDVDDIRAVYGVAGYQDERWNVRAGVQPVIIDGAVRLTLPTDVDNTGNLQYTDQTLNVRNSAEYFINATRSFNMRYADVHVNAGTTTSGKDSASITLEIDF